MMLKKIDFESFDSEYSNPNCPSYKKSRIVKDYIPDGKDYLDIGIGARELISLRGGRNKKISGSDYDKTSCAMGKRRLYQYADSNLIKSGITDIQKNFTEQFNCITCFDVLKNTEERDVVSVLEIINNILNKKCTVFFSGPSIFKKVRFYFGRSVNHLHSHSSYCWKKMIESAGFIVSDIETADFPTKKGAHIWKILHHCCTKEKYWGTL